MIFTGCTTHDMKRAASGCSTCSFIEELERARDDARLTLAGVRLDLESHRRRGDAALERARLAEQHLEALRRMARELAGEVSEVAHEVSVSPELDRGREHGRLRSIRDRLRNAANGAAALRGDDAPRVSPDAAPCRGTANSGQTPAARAPEATPARPAVVFAKPPGPPDSPHCATCGKRPKALCGNGSWHGCQCPTYVACTPETPCRNCARYVRASPAAHPETPAPADAGKETT